MIDKKYELNSICGLTTDRGHRSTPKNVWHCQSLHHISHVDSPRIWTGFAPREADGQPPETR